MDETKLENKLACFFSKVKKLVTDYMTYIDTRIGKCEEICKRAESSTVELGDIDKALDELIAMADTYDGR